MSLIFSKLASAAGGSDLPATVVFAAHTDGLSAYNVENSSSMSHISTLSNVTNSTEVTSGPAVYSHKRKHVYARGYAANGSQVLSIDVSDPSSMSFADSLDNTNSNLNQFPYGMALDDINDVLYVAGNSGYVQTFDVSDPTNIADIATKSYTTAVDSGDIVLDLKNNRALVVYSSSTSYKLCLLSINSSGTLSNVLASFTSSTDEVSGSKECLALDVEGKRCFVNTSAWGYIIDYSSDTLTSLNRSAEFGRAQSGDRMHYRDRDKVVFSHADAIAWDVSATNSKTKLSEITSIRRFEAFDDFRLIAFGTDNTLPDGSIVAIDASNPSSPSTLSTLQDSNINLATSMVPNTSGPSATFAYK